MSMSRISFLAVSLAVTLLLGGCGSQPDYAPFAEGMKAIAVALVVVAVVGALADLVMADDKRKDLPPPSRPRKPQNNESKGGKP